MRRTIFIVFTVSGDAEAIYTTRDAAHAHAEAANQAGQWRRFTVEEDQLRDEFEGLDA